VGKSDGRVRERLIETLRRHLEGDTVLCLPSAWTIASLKTAPSVEPAANRVEDLTLARWRAWPERLRSAFSW